MQVHARIQRKTGLATLLAAGLFAVPALAVPINYGDFNAASVKYLQVTEDSTTDPTPLFGGPTIAGDAMVFNPVSFGASSTNGAAPDITDGTLKTTVVANQGFAIHKIKLTEAGDYTLAGTGTGATNVSVAAPVFLRILELDGVGINPIPVNANLVFSPSGSYALPGNVGTGVIWTGLLEVDIDAVIANAGFSGFATRLSWEMDNQLLAFSESGTIAFIKKKATEGVTFTPTVPEPMFGGMAAAIGALVLRRRRA